MKRRLTMWCVFEIEGKKTKRRMWWFSTEQRAKDFVAKRQTIPGAPNLSKPCQFVSEDVVLAMMNSLLVADTMGDVGGVCVEMLDVLGSERPDEYASTDDVVNKLCVDRGIPSIWTVRDDAEDKTNE